MKIFIFIFLPMLVFGGNLNWMNSTELSLKYSKIENKPVLLFVYSESCKYCSMFVNRSKQSKKLSTALNRFVLVGVKKGAFEINGVGFETEVTPSFYLYGSNGVLLTAPIHGYVEIYEFANYLNNIADLHLKYGNRERAK